MARRNHPGVGDAPDGPRVGGALALKRATDGPTAGPYDDTDDGPQATDAATAGTVDFGAVRMPVPAQGEATVEPAGGGHPPAVHVALPEGRLSVSALAAPKSSRLWPELASEIEVSLRDGGARVRSFPGDWGRELHATTGAVTSIFVGVDGPRWMLYGVAVGLTTGAAALDAELRQVLRGTVVVRGPSPYPVRTVLPLVVPEHSPEAVAAAGPSAAVVPDPEPDTAALPTLAGPAGRHSSRPRSQPPTSNGRRRRAPEPEASRSERRRASEPEGRTELLPTTRVEVTASLAAAPPRGRGRHAAPEPDDVDAAAEPAVRIGPRHPVRPAGRHRKSG